jgi:diguanylate cyclase (GGDEF)-like protein
MTARSLDSLPDAVAQAVRTARVPLELRAVLHQLGHWTLRATVPADPTKIPQVVRQLLKLCLLPGDDLELLSVTTGELALEVAREGKVKSLSSADLRQDLRGLLQRLSSDLVPPLDLAFVAEALAKDLARETTVRKLSARMLRADDLDEALYAMLLGITSGYGAGFPRAALFTYDGDQQVFRGALAVGPKDAAEAHRIWEALETEDKTFDEVLDDYRTLKEARGYQELVQSLVLAAGGEGDEIAAALSSREPRVFTTPPKNPGLALLLEPATEFVLSVIEPRGVRLGLIVADNAYGEEPVVPAQLEWLAALEGPTSLVWDTRHLLHRVDALARHDPLTGLYNRRELEERFVIEQSRCARAGRPISMAMIDLDHFKDINDTQGHPAGDKVLQRVGVLLGGHLRHHDIPVRLGGDEFVLLLPEATKKDLQGAATRIGHEAREEGISLSIGAATWPDDTPDVTTLLALADEQLYVAKNQGRACLCLPGEEPIPF